MKQTIDAIIASMTEYIINYAGTHGAWRDYDNIEEIKQEISCCDFPALWETIEEEELDFYTLYSEALALACDELKYKLKLYRDVWYAADKDFLVDKVCEDCPETGEELYAMVEEIGGEVEGKVERKVSVYNIIDEMAAYIVRYAEKHGAWTSWEDIEALRAEFGECKNILEMIDKNNFNFSMVYDTALDLAFCYHGFYYQIVLSYYDNFKFGHLHYLAWYSKDKDKLVEKFYEDDNHSEYYTKEEIYKMVEKI